MEPAAARDIEIRPVREGDAEAIIAIDRLAGADAGAQQPHPSAAGTAKAGFWRGMVEAYVSGESPEEGPSSIAPKLIQVAVRGGRGVVGFAAGDVQPWQFGMARCGRIIAIGVLPEERRRKVASRLATSLMDVFARIGVPVVQCLVRPTDTLRKFFESLGFDATDWVTLQRRP